MSKSNKTGTEGLTAVPNEPVTLDENKASDATVKEDNTGKVDDKKAETVAKDENSTKDTKEEKTVEKKETGVEEKPSEKEKSSEETYDEEAPPPPPPPRPVSPVTQMKQELKGAFPNVEEKYITAALIASRGQIDPAFNALLYLSDPSVEPEIPISAAPSAPAYDPTDDEKLARKLQQEFEQEDRRRRSKHLKEKRERERLRRIEQGEDDSPDELDQIKETFTQSLEGARTTLNGWVSGIAKKFQDPNEESLGRYRSEEGGRYSHPDSGSSQNKKLFGALGGSSYFSNTDRVNKKSNFDDDPQLISNDFSSKIRMNDGDDDGPSLPRRKDDNQFRSGNKPEITPGSTKWQQLNSDVPLDSDAFLVTDSEDEESTPKDAKQGTK